MKKRDGGSKASFCHRMGRCLISLMGTDILHDPSFDSHMERKFPWSPVYPFVYSPDRKMSSRQILFGQRGFLRDRCRQEEKDRGRVFYARDSAMRPTPAALPSFRGIVNSGRKCYKFQCRPRAMKEAVDQVLGRTNSWFKIPACREVGR